MVLNQPKTPLEWTDLPDRHPGSGQIRVNVLACGVCRTDLHVLDGELPNPNSPIIPGHEIVGRIKRLVQGSKASAWAASWHPVAWAYLWHLPLLQRAQGKSVRCPLVHWIHARWWVLDESDC